VDVVSDVLSTVRTGPAFSVFTQLHAPWALDFPTARTAVFHVVVAGRCWLSLDDRPPQVLTAGDVVLLAHGTAHRLVDEPRPVDLGVVAVETPLGPASRFVVEGTGDSATLLCGAFPLDRERLHPLLADLPLVLHTPGGPGQRETRQIVDLLAAEASDTGPGASPLVTALVDAMLVYLLRTWLTAESATCSGWAAALRDPVLSRALAALHGDPAHPWTVESLGQRAGLSRAAFARRFTAGLGEPPLAYLTRWRMTLAARQLRRTEDPLAAVARTVGYESEFAFARAFKRAYGAAPGSYRRAA
jgi:AraC-like DNA-binding protein